MRDSIILFCLLLTHVNIGTNVLVPVGVVFKRETGLVSSRSQTRFQEGIIIIKNNNKKMKNVSSRSRTRFQYDFSETATANAWEEKIQYNSLEKRELPKIKKIARRRLALGTTQRPTTRQDFWSRNGNAALKTVQVARIFVLFYVLFHFIFNAVLKTVQLVFMVVSFFRGFLILSEIVLKILSSLCLQLHSTYIYTMYINIIYIHTSYLSFLVRHHIF